MTTRDIKDIASRWWWKVAAALLPLEQSFLATMRQLNGLEFPYVDGLTRTAYELVEEL